MKIYSLNDEIVEERDSSKKRDLKNRDDLGDRFLEGKTDGKVLRITNIRQAVKNQNRVNVFVNEQFAFSLDIAQVVEFKLRVGMELSRERLVELKRSSEFGKLYQRTLEWVLMRPRSEREVSDYLLRKFRSSYSSSWNLEEFEEIKRQIIKRLRERKYLDDYQFADYYIKNRFVKKGISKKRLLVELRKKGVAEEIIEEVLGGREDEEEIRKMIARKRGKYDDEKMIAYLCRQGFSYDLVKRIVEEESENDWG